MAFHESFMAYASTQMTLSTVKLSCTILLVSFCLQRHNSSRTLLAHFHIEAFPSHPRFRCPSRGKSNGKGALAFRVRD